MLTANQARSHREPGSPLPQDSQSEAAELDGKYSDDHDRAASSLADESCQTALNMPEMQVVSSLAQLVHCERRTQLRGGASPRHVLPDQSTYSASETRSATPSVTWASDSSPAATAKNQVTYPHVIRNYNTTPVTPRPGIISCSQASPPKAHGPVKAKWNSTVKCNWPPTYTSSTNSPPRLGGGGAVGGATPRSSRPTTAGEGGRMSRSVGVMTFPAISAEELIKKVEALEFELDVHVGNERQLLTVNEKLRKRLEMCLRELNDAGMMNLQLDNLNDEMEKILMLLRHLSERNAALEKEKVLMQAKLEREAALNKYTAAKMLVERQMEDQYVDLCDAECQTVCSCQQADTRKRRRERKRWLEEETPLSNQLKSRSLSPTQFRRADNIDSNQEVKFL